MKDTFSITIILRKTKTDSLVGHLYARVTLNQQRKEISTHLKVVFEKWDNKAQCLKGNSEAARTLNNTLDSIKSRIVKIYNDFKFKDGNVTLDQLLNSYNGKGKDGQIHTLLEVFKIHNKKAKQLVGIDYAKATYTRFNSTINHCEEFLKTLNKTDIPLSELNIGFLKDLEHFFKTVRKCNHNSTVKYIRIVMKITRLSIEYGWLEKDPFFGFKQQLQEVNRGFLSEEDLLKLENKVISNVRLDTTRDMFVFCCYTGLAYVDVHALTPTDIVKYPDGEYWINIYREKTKVKSNILLLPKALEIIEKYKDNPECDITGKVLPLRSNVKYNEYLKEVATICDINLNLTTHLARHTFATTVTLNNDVPIESVSAMLGHKNIKTTQI